MNYRIIARVLDGGTEWLCGAGWPYRTREEAQKAINQHLSIGLEWKIERRYQEGVWYLGIPEKDSNIPEGSILFYNWLGADCRVTTRYCEQIRFPKLDARKAPIGVVSWTWLPYGEAKKVLSEN